MLKQLIRRLAHRLLGFDNYLLLFAWFSGVRMRWLGAEKEFRFFMSLVPDEGAILDIGANIGFMSVALAQRHSRATIFAFEPMPVNLKALNRIVAHHRLEQVRIMPFALGDQNGMANMLMPVVKKTRMQGYSHVIEPGQSFPQEQAIAVTMRRLDDLEELRTVKKISAIKIDVENYEYFVLKGGETLLRKHHPLIYCELWNDARREASIRFLQGLGYRVMIYQNNALVAFNGQSSVNYFFVHEGEKDAAPDLH